jgi:hypothetical protein
MFLEVLDQGLNILRVRGRHGFISALIARHNAGFSAIEVILPALSAKELSGRSDAEAL